MTMFREFPVIYAAFSIIGGLHRLSGVSAAPCHEGHTAALPILQNLFPTGHL